MMTQSRFLQGAFEFECHGLAKPAGSTVEIHLAAPDGSAGTVVVDLGLVEV